jgi:nucleotide-binding universal stress UspA family protein
MRALIATDGSDVAVEAARRGLEVLAAPSAVVMVCVITSVPGDEAGGFEGPVETPEEQEREWAREQVDAEAALERTVAALPTSVAVERLIETGDEGPTICAVAERERIDVIITGSHGRGWLGRIVHLGSVSEYVMRHAPCPVLVVRAGAGDSDAG